MEGTQYCPLLGCSRPWQSSAYAGHSLNQECPAASPSLRDKERKGAIPPERPTVSWGLLWKKPLPLAVAWKTGEQEGALGALSFEILQRALRFHKQEEISPCSRDSCQLTLFYRTAILPGASGLCHPLLPTTWPPTLPSFPEPADLGTEWGNILILPHKMSADFFKIMFKSLFSEYELNW